ncbi:hypothetical protein EW146_g4045 [Bondarzewia mesenterica]|uniref:Uncharacterized protein n=1 Tax=Bondarzewia mesenterica TaxID=1095465 RepID=A0A4V3XF96_9AGAM|nr:hypothetical protein EW146_g4045 [Bondarzewia mesenterica]
MSSSLLSNLTEMDANAAPATDVIKYLIAESIAPDVCAFRRNTQVSYRLVDRARDIFNRINTLIRSVDEEDNWDNYDKFTAAIDPLEECVFLSFLAGGFTESLFVFSSISPRRRLFSLTALAEDESSQYLSDSTSLDACITSVSKWESNRAGLRTALRDLFSHSAFIPPSSEVWHVHVANRPENIMYASLVQVDVVRFAVSFISWLGFWQSLTRSLQLM